MGLFKIEWKNSAVKELRRLDRSTVSRIHEAVSLLAVNPYPPGCQKLRGSEGVYRIRVGNYRVIYEVLEHRLILEIARVGHRKDVYR